MSREVKKRASGFVLTGIAIFFTIALIGATTFLAWIFHLKKDLEERLASQKWLETVSFYSAPLRVPKNSIWSTEELAREIDSRAWGNRVVQKPSSVECAALSPNSTRCLRYETAVTTHPEMQAAQKFAIFWGDADLVIDVQRDGASVNEALVEPMYLATTAQNELVQTKWTQLGQFPPACLQAVMAAEDKKFLEHSGIQLTSLARAFFRNLFSGRAREGGSTITQQLIKNSFLTPEKTVKRKFNEFWMALLLETVLNKDQILENYLNVIYLGQNGPYQVRGFGAAARYYFNRDLMDLGTAQCALLAGVLNSPGQFNPWTNPAKATAKRNGIVQKMFDLGYLTEDDRAKAVGEALPAQRPALIQESVPYFLTLGFLEDQKKFDTVYLTMNPSLQNEVQKIARTRVPGLRKKANDVEIVVLTLDLARNEITSAIGGSSYRKSQFNRINQAKRQIGSLMKPLVYSLAFQKDHDLTPESVFHDGVKSFEYEGQTWEPQNYNQEYFGDVPLSFALKMSLNSVAADLVFKLGPSELSSFLNRLFPTLNASPYPSLALGAVNLSPLDVLELESILPRFGNLQRARSLQGGVDTHGESVPVADPTSTNVIDSASVAQTVSMLQQTLQTGTAKASRLMGWQRISAGKTGTTSDEKDAWFVGFTSEKLTLVWVGSDSNLSTGLTGASGAMPIWVDVMKELTKHDLDHEFVWPETVSVRDALVYRK